MAAWPELARQLLRPGTRRPQLWRSRAACGVLFAAAGIWAAVAPQANFALGERLRLGFGTVTVMMVALAALAGPLHGGDYNLFEHVRVVPAWQRAWSRILSVLARGAADLLPALPLLLCALALEAVSVWEFWTAIFWTATALLVSASVAEFKGPVLLWPIAAAVIYAKGRRPPFEVALILLYAAHLYCKTRMAWNSAARMRSPNLAFESTTALSVGQLCRWRGFHPALCALAAAQMVFLATIHWWPLQFEEKSALALVLIFGAISLFVDAYALHWRGMLDAKAPKTLATILGGPWAVAWALAALHTGDAFTLNEGAAYFLVWTASGLTLSWRIGTTAKETVTRNFRELLADRT